MVNIDSLICQSINPFDERDLKAGNFWIEQQDTKQTIESIHLEEIKKIESYLDVVSFDHSSRTLLLLGDSGSGKSYLLGRLKRELNNKAFFVYIDPWVDSRFLWRHILRKTISSLLYIPPNQSESQLILWLKNLPVVKNSKFQKSFNNEERKRFIVQLKNSYPNGINNAREFFGILYDLLNPSLSDLASDWLKGDHLSEDDLKDLRISSSINNEDYARGILENLGRISVENLPFIFCFDQLDNIPLSSSGFIDLQSLFNFNTNIHTQIVKNFLIIISMPTSTWNDNEKRIQPADLAEGRLHQKITLKTINKKQIEAIWTLKVSGLHSQAKPKPNSSIYPLNQQQIDINFSSGKTLPRNVLIVGRKLYQSYKDGLSIITPHPDLLSLFKLSWPDEFQKSRNKIISVNQLTALELLKILDEVLQVLKCTKASLKFSSNNVNSGYLSFLKAFEKNCIIWTEDQNMNYFCNVMKYCKKEIEAKTYHHLYLLRYSTLGNPSNKGYQIYKSIFKSPHKHIQPTLTSIHYLTTYHQLMMDAKSKELVIGGEIIDLPTLEDLMRQSRIFENCQLLLDLGLIKKTVEENLIKTESNQEENEKIKNYLLKIIQTQNFISLPALIEKALEHFSHNFLLNFDQVQQLTKEICQQDLAIITNPDEPIEKQLICLNITPKIKDDNF
ncbi:KAP family P-loop domain-containing protein [Aphanothece hegewaldii CCALA 016]|uniref:KAP family P-loop domain-containing protein n=1 Tax=Aphanothece hegewaldii CCALA 016 TaxID=2107694 RepID=A0A2T1LSF3_9CHRO|nr:ATP-binding protein [Aphanothece hegewaldii]PSF32475.1 KAP family P-loop domain-containing protein [Aphanothece hegewaldii CCALA 016]